MSVDIIKDEDKEKKTDEAFEQKKPDTTLSTIVEEYEKRLKEKDATIADRDKTIRLLINGKPADKTPEKQTDGIPSELKKYLRI